MHFPSPTSFCPVLRFGRLRSGLAVAVAVSAAALAGCGGGWYLGDVESVDDTPPSVSLVTAETSVRAGQTVRLVAAAADENGIDAVVFYREDGSTDVLLGSDGTAPYEWVATVPTDGRTTISFFAHAEDIAGNETDSAVITLTVTP
jgi:hypothetical protein